VSQKKQIVAVPVYVLVDDDATVLPTAQCKFIRPNELQNLPRGQNFYMVSGNGTYLHKDTGLIEAIVPVPGVAGLGFLESDCRLRMSKLPALVAARALTFFRKVFASYKSEAEVMLLYNESERKYDLFCPEQKVTGGHVDYKLGDSMQRAMQELGKDWKIGGTIHSHCDFSAFHSGTDTDDESNQDGIHITFGHVVRKNFSCVSSIAVNGHRWQVPPSCVIKGISNRTEEESEGSTYIVSNSQDDYYNLRLTPEEQAQLKTTYANQIDNEWYKRVSKPQQGKHFYS
jgi:proteasome lid subunit RPN8/RPN11